MRVIGRKNRSDIELDPIQAWRRGRLADAMLRAAAAPIARGVFRGSHRYFNQMDEARQILAARRLNRE